MAKGLLEIILEKILAQIFDADLKGKIGEKLTERELSLVKLMGRKGTVLRNVYIPKDNGETSEIDVLFITQKGIFVIESKNYSGWVFGDEKSQYWTVMLPNKEKHRLYNPIKQNKTHIKWLSNYLGDTIPLFSMIVFSQRCELKKIELESDDIPVIKREYVYAAVRKIWEKSPDVLTEDDVQTITEKLRILTNADDAVKQAHIDTINAKYKKPDTKQINLKDNSESKKCPKCGSNLILRTASKGEKAGRQFYGCSAFPKCRFIENIEI